ncbi:MAG: 23S rRNA (pseudouridine(1915)-N(3))-methyltransferase RlmH [Christensenellales bacterium]|uniref:Ribosomal RNA large subunit methyltransferase H n=1 Tax=Candidatus Avichristensenella intestinipullorum TaxID=2840693 RepID=A0A9D0YW30_9FIRM|nr:23S rRNA (pseudouridine(1915)-N(3))-methyltransferase RlmH [Christensenellales bacterium]HIQ63042.1 23S rRNA (pseudouridine(1915)-N(3))-methyltransferase RlmH [Candidatus Avichristensenella intestinipullorum]
MITAILCAGKLREAFWREAAEEYIRRLKRFGPLEMLECPDLPEPRNASAADIARLVEAESAAMLRQLRPQDYVVALCVEARSLSSPALAERLARIEAGGARRLVFVLGGSNGLSPALLARANERLSFSPMTFPHQLARVMLLEQLYRCRKILAHEAYHK